MSVFRGAIAVWLAVVTVVVAGWLADMIRERNDR